MMEQRIPVIVKIRDVQSGETVDHKDDLLVDDTYDGIPIWRDGNYSCDCNRKLFFERAKGGDLEPEQPCGDAAYTVYGIYRVDTGELLWSEKNGRGA